MGSLASGNSNPGDPTTKIFSNAPLTKKSDNTRRAATPTRVEVNIHWLREFLPQLLSLVIVSAAPPGISVSLYQLSIQTSTISISACSYINSVLGGFRSAALAGAQEDSRWRETPGLDRAKAAA